MTDVVLEHMMIKHSIEICYCSALQQFNQDAICGPCMDFGCICVDDFFEDEE